MDDDDKFWQIPQGHSWADTGAMLKRLSPRAGAQTISNGKVRRRRNVRQSGAAQARDKASLRTPQETAAYYREVAAFYRRTDQAYEAGLWERRADAILAKINSNGADHG